MGIKIYLDDIRQTPDGFIRTYTVEETIKLLEDNNGDIDTISLDNDLGEGLLEGQEVARWIEKQSFFGLLKPIPNLRCHSDNTPAIKEMVFAFTAAKKFWKLREKL